MKILSKPLVLSCLALAGLGLNPAMAADLPEPPPATPLVPLIFDWTGGYIGAQVGYGWGGADHRLEGFESTTSNNVNGGLFGVYSGRNYQFPNSLVLGYEADIVWNGQKGGPDVVILCPCYPDSSNRVSSDLKWSAAVRGRVGYAVGDFLPYVAGGLALARIHADYDFVDLKGETNETMTGWTLGAGMDYAFADNLTFRAEYRYSDFGSVTEHPFLPTFANSQTIRLNSQDLRVGISVRF